jgi:transcriptional regulator with XRE-family HTH domain
MSQYGDHYCEGSRLLAKALKGVDGKTIEQKSFAEAAKLDPTFLNHLLYGRKRPSIATASAIERAAGEFGVPIPASTWAQSRQPPKKKAAKEEST